MALQCSLMNYVLPLLFNFAAWLNVTQALGAKQTTLWEGRGLFNFFVGLRSEAVTVNPAEHRALQSQAI